MDIAIVGLPQSGKTTTFQALTAGHGSASAEARGELVGVVKIPDERLYKLAELVKAKKTTPVEVFLHDLPPLFHDELVARVRDDLGKLAELCPELDLSLWPTAGDVA